MILRKRLFCIELFWVIVDTWRRFNVYKMLYVLRLLVSKKYPFKCKNCTFWEEYTSNIKKRRLFALRQKCLYSELFWTVFPRIRTEYGEIFRISQYSLWIQENTDQNNSEYGFFIRSVNWQQPSFLVDIQSKLITNQMFSVWPFCGVGA